MLPQQCSRIHYPITINVISKNQLNYLNNSLNICCFDYLMSLDEYYSDNLMNNHFYFQFTKIVYSLDKKNLLDFQNYSKESLLKFIIISNKICCYYYIIEKVKYSKFLSNLIVRIIQKYFKKNNNNIIIINNKLNKKYNNYVNDLKNNNIISTIYNNACCNYFKTLSYNKCLKFLEYSNKNIEENDLNNKLIFYNNSLIISTKNKINCNTNDIDNNIKIIKKLILLRQKNFDNIYLNNIHYNNGGTNNNGNLILNNLRKNEENYNSFKLLSFIMYNYGYSMEKILKQKKQAKKYYKNSYEYICKYLGKNSLEAQKFLFKINNKISNNNFIESMYFNKLNDEEEMFEDNKKRRNLTPINLRGKNNKNNNNYDEDIDMRLKSIIQKIENFEQILQNKEVLTDIILNDNNNRNFKENQSQYEFKSSKTNNNYNYQKENVIHNHKKGINNISIENNDFQKKKNDIINGNYINTEVKSNKYNNKNNINNYEENKEENKFLDNNKKNDEKKEEKKEIQEIKKINSKEKITFDMMDNIIEEFKKESQEKMEQQKKLKEEKEKERKIKEENEKKEEKEKESDNKEMKIKIEKTEEKKDDSQPKKPLRIKKLFQKVLGRQEKEPPKTKLGELFQSLMRNPQEEKKKEPNEGGKEIKIGKETSDNFINLDDDEDDIKDNNKNNNNIINEENNYTKISEKTNNKPKSGYGFKININLDKSDYSYNATTFYQENDTSE